MCGIIGYNGSLNAQDLILEGLSKIEYRGYDSAGLAILEAKGKVALVKTKGGVAELEAKIDGDQRGKMGIGHTRWATHGIPSVKNAHPHKSTNFYIVHNGIIENHAEIADFLADQGFGKLQSDTDTEVLAWLLEYNYQKSENIRSALAATLNGVRGAFGLAIIHRDTPNVLYVARRSSPIVIAELEHGFMVASDVTAIPPEATHATYLDDDQFAVITPASMRVYNMSHDLVNHTNVKLDLDRKAHGKDGEQHFMMKEILEQPTSVAETIRGRLDKTRYDAVLGGLNMDEESARKLRSLTSVACGTAHYSSVLASYLLEEVVDIPLRAEVASEFLYRNQRYEVGQDMVLAVSQSGETADTIAAINKMGLKGVRTYGIVNAVGSTISRITDGGTYLRCGPEIAVASTKAFTSQVVAQLMLGLRINSLRGNPIKNNRSTVESLLKLPAELEKTIQQVSEPIVTAAQKVEPYNQVMFLGRGSLYPMALEGALKYKEITYTPAQAHPAGEMKHGPLALIDKDTVVVYLLREGSLLDKSLSNLREIEARKGKVLVITDSAKLHKQREDSILIPGSTDINSPLLFNVALQLLAYHVANKRGLSIDKPRNLAKSVTVE